MNDTRRILIATGLYPPEIGGPATNTVFLERYLPERGLATTIVPFSKVRHLPRVLRHIAYFALVLRAARGVDVLWVQDPVSVGVPAMLAAWIRRIPYILRVPGDYAWERGVALYGIEDPVDEFVRDTSKYPLFVRVLAFLERVVAKRAAEIVVPSEYLKGVVEMWGVPSVKVRVIYNAFIPTETAQALREADKEAVRSRLSLPTPLLVSVGRMVPWKGFFELIESIPALVRAYPSLVLVIIGEGPDRAALERHVNALKLNDHVILMEPMSRDRLFAYIRAADVFILNSYYEGFSHQLVEAMYLKTPVVATAVGGNPELIVSHVSGALVPPRSRAQLELEIRRIIKDRSMARRYTEQASRRVAQFSLEAMLDGVVEVLEHVTS